MIVYSFQTNNLSLKIMDFRKHDSTISWIIQLLA